ncbi:Nup84p [Lachancea thermotolerans CBS 6340]|uniref:Nuclear pore complex protein n=1 Tax=Lachancea thermotolerans (strain ATCC 56472 / CBS 6340 / NRRL Y-8284) TaxID=559295 RepID=C5DL18_LACTC|nr:KLTH0F09262p [Lachancea thermotolerans CBS 6340]CAR24169.1 KLTH0F09262p [Lachancea thermotolerans CBS 6340]
MEVDTIDSYEALVKFANVLKDFRVGVLNDPGSRDAFDVVKDFRSIAGEGALDIARTDSSERGGVFENWELEAKLWHLIELLVNFRTADLNIDEDIEQLEDDSLGFTKSLLKKDRSLYEIWLIMLWIQSNISVPARPDGIAGSKWSHSFMSGELKSCDLDYPLRESDCKIDNRDKQSDHAFYKYIYELLLAGRYDDARKECELSDNTTLALILCGLDNYVGFSVGEPANDDLQPQENIKGKALWRRAVHSLSLQQELDEYERAIYSYLAGDVFEGIDTNWDIDLLLYLNQALQISLENHLLEDKLVDSKEIILPMASDPVPLQSVLDIIARKHVAEGEHPIRVLMGAVILDKIPTVVKSSTAMLLDVVKGKDASNDMVEEPYLLRVVTHLVILMDFICPGLINEQDKSKLITAYVTILSLYQLYNEIPVYISFLDDSEALEAYSFFLSNLTNAAARKKQLDLCNILKIPTANILRRTTQRVFDDTEGSYNPTAGIIVDNTVDEIDKRVVASVEWLTEGKLYVDAINAIIVLSRRFLINGKIRSLSYLYETHDIDNVIKNFEMDTISDPNSCKAAVDEIKQYKELIDIHEQFEQWDALLVNSQSESNLPHLLKKFKQLCSNVYRFSKSFLIELSESPGIAGSDVIYEIRALYTPHLIVKLHNSLVTASRELKIESFINEALSLANLVANETDRIYLLFQSSGRLQEYLQLIAKTATFVKTQ